MSDRYFIPGRAPAPRPPAPGVVELGAGSYHIPGGRRLRWTNPVRRARLARRYPNTSDDVLDLLAQYPEEAADPVTLAQLAALEPGRTIAALLKRRHPGLAAGPPAERGEAPVWRRPRPRIERDDDLDDVPF